ncbi:MAG: cell envelope integrity protein CreD [Flavobacterium sp.]|nr:cell envelope integrity protein CreD [Flavobacterium sp.]
MENQNEKWGFLHSATARMMMVGLLVLVLLIPLEFVKSLIDERAQRQKEVISETTDKWGESVYFYGPMIKVPFKIYTETVSVNEVTKEAVTQKTSQTEFAYFYPETLNNKTKVSTKVLHRSNYESVVFNAQMAFDGHYIRPDFASRDIQDEDIDWSKATVIIRTTNLKSIRNEVKISLNGKSYIFEPIYSENANQEQSLETGPLDAEIFTGQKVSFAFDIAYNGSEQIKIVPIGKTTTAMMESNWASPSFTGNFLPGETVKQISDKGFKTDWKVLQINRPFSQMSFNIIPDLREFAFGVDFIIPVDQYQQNERAAKYGFLVIGLTFLIFFLIQTISKIKIHIFQYTMVGIALIMFYTLLISITEHSSFKIAYVIAGTSVVVLITAYSYSILKIRRFPMFIGASLTALYSFIYVIIQLENYALLFGSIGLFLILAAVMYFSRKIEWS